MRRLVRYELGGEKHLLTKLFRSRKPTKERRGITIN